MIKQLNKENFSEVLDSKGEVFVKFATKTGCQPFNQQCYVEDLLTEVNNRRQATPEAQCIAQCETNCGDDVECKRGCVAHCNPEARKELEEHLKEVVGK